MLTRDHTVLPATYTFIHVWNEPSYLYSVGIYQMAPPERGSTHPIPAYYSFIDLGRMKGWVGLIGWPIADGLPTYVVTHQLPVKRKTTQGKFAGQRPTFYHCATQPTCPWQDLGMHWPWGQKV